MARAPGCRRGARTSRSTLHAARVETPTVDEFAHVPAGVAAWRQGRTDLYRSNPPLLKLVLAAPLALDPAVGGPALASSRRSLWGPWEYGHRFMNANRERYLALMARARAARSRSGSSPARRLRAGRARRSACARRRRERALPALPERSRARRTSRRSTWARSRPSLLAAYARCASRTGGRARAARRRRCSARSRARGQVRGRPPAAGDRDPRRRRIAGADRDRPRSALGRAGGRPRRRSASSRCSL